MRSESLVTCLAFSLPESPSPGPCSFHTGCLAVSGTRHPPRVLIRSVSLPESMFFPRGLLGFHPHFHLTSPFNAHPFLCYLLLQTAHGLVFSASVPFAPTCHRLLPLTLYHWICLFIVYCPSPSNDNLIECELSEDRNLHLFCSLM